MGHWGVFRDGDLMCRRVPALAGDDFHVPYDSGWLLYL
jgi:hypothetical protein